MMRTYSDTNFRVDIKITKQRKNKDSTVLVGYVEFEDTETTESAHGDGSVQIGGESKVLYYAKRKDQPQREKVIISDKKLFVTGVPDTVNEDELTSLLGDCTISGRENGKKFFFAEYSTPEDQTKALSKLTNAQIGGQKIMATPAYEKARMGGRKPRGGSR